MSRRRTVRQIEESEATVEAALQGVLDELCTALGFCVGPEVNARLRTSPPEGVDTFVEAVIRAEGMDPTYVDGRLLTRMRDIVEVGAGRVL